MMPSMRIFYITYDIMYYIIYCFDSSPLLRPCFTLASSVFISTCLHLPLEHQKEYSDRTPQHGSPSAGVCKGCRTQTFGARKGSRNRCSPARTTAEQPGGACRPRDTQSAGCKMPSLLSAPQSLGNVTWRPPQERRFWMRPVRQLQKSSPGKLFVKKRRTREKCGWQHSKTKTKNQ